MEGGAKDIMAIISFAAWFCRFFDGPFFPVCLHVLYILGL